MMDKRHILVTGGAGFIGSHLCESLLKKGAWVVSADNFNDFYNPSLKRDNIRQVEKTAEKYRENGCRFTSFQADIRDKAHISEIFSSQPIDAVVHIAAYAGVRPSIESPSLYFDVNINGTLNILECMRHSGIKAMVFASSSSVYGNNKKVPFSEDDPVDNPISPYAATKKAGELLCHTYHHLYKMSIACLRFFTVYGPRQRPDLAIRKFTECIGKGREIPIYGDGTTRRDYTHITDIIDGVTSALRWSIAASHGYEIFNLGGTETVSLSEMVETIENALGKKAVRRVLPEQPGDVMQTNADLSKVRRALGYSPKVRFKDGIADFISWYNDTCF